MSIAPTPIPPGAAQAAAERRAIIRDETGRVAVALIGHGLDVYALTEEHTTLCDGADTMLARLRTGGDIATAAGQP